VKILAAIIAVGTGLIVLAGYFIIFPPLVQARELILGWAMILAAVAVIVGIANLLSVHVGRITGRKKGRAYSALLIVALVGALALGLALGPQSMTVQALFNGIQLPVEASLMAVLAVSLLYATIRLLRWRSDWMAVVFILTALLIFLGTAPLPFLGYIPIVSDWLRPWVAQVPAAAGARGILLGVALGTLLTGLRILFAADRPYGGK
jgi:hypothetical protein